jgi:hypothetical protein
MDNDQMNFLKLSELLDSAIAAALLEDTSQGSSRGTLCLNAGQTIK